MKKKLASIILSALVFGLLSTGVSAYDVKTYGNNLSYNRQAAKNYVYQYVLQYNKDDYVYFSPQEGGDCTNFASQALAAGGISFTNRVSNPTINHWYYYGSSWGYNRTATWTGAHEFRQHFAEVNGQGRKRAYQFRKYTSYELASNTTIWNNLFNNIGAGDIVQYTDASTGRTYHTQVVHRKSTGEEGPGINKLSMAQHTEDGWRNLRNTLIFYGDSSTNYRWITVIRLNSSTTW